MNRELDIFNALHRRTVRDYLGRMNDDKVVCMRESRKYGREFWDGERRFGYGGYRYDGRWRPVAQRLKDIYGLGGQAAILEVGCGKGFLLHELRQELPGGRVAGFDISAYAIEHAKEEVRPYLHTGRAEDPLPYRDGEFDLVISLLTLHNLHLPDLLNALREIQRVGREKYVLVESYRNEAELFNLQCWALTCESFFRPEGWRKAFELAGYTGDHEFIFFE